MSREEAAGIGLENTLKRLLEGATESNAPPIVDVKQRREASVPAPATANNEKIAHDLRASLNIIIGFTELMLDGVTGKISMEQRRCLTDILSNAKRLFDLSDEIIKRLEAVSENIK